MDIDGTFYSNTNINGNLNRLYLDGALGGNLGGTDYGILTVYGFIKTLRFNTASNLVADLTVGGSASGRVALLTAERLCGRVSVRVLGGQAADRRKQNKLTGRGADW